MKQNVFIVALAAVVLVVVSAGASWDRPIDHGQYRSADHRSGFDENPCEDWPYTMSIFDDTPQLLQADLCFLSTARGNSIDIDGDGDPELITWGYGYAGIGSPMSVYKNESPGQLRQYIVLDFDDAFQLDENSGSIEVNPVGVLDVTGDGMADLVVVATGSNGGYFYFENILTPPLAFCDEDVNEDGQVAVDDILAVISAWGDSCL